MFSQAWPAVEFLEVASQLALVDAEDLVTGAARGNLKNGVAGTSANTARAGGGGAGPGGAVSSNVTVTRANTRPSLVSYNELGLS